MRVQRAQDIDGSSNLVSNAKELVGSGADIAGSDLGGGTGIGALLGPDATTRADSTRGD